MALALDGVPDQAVLERRAALLDEAQASRAGWDAAAARLADAERQLPRARQEHATAYVGVTSALHDAGALGARWAEATAEAGVPRSSTLRVRSTCSTLRGALRAALLRPDEGCRGRRAGRA